MNPKLIIFMIFAGLAIISAVIVISTPNVIRSAVALVANFLILAVLYFMMNFDLLGISQILVYSGLIMMLFLFCILLLNLGSPEMLIEKNKIKIGVAGAIAVALVFIIGVQVAHPLGAVANPASPDDIGKAKSVGTYLFNHWVYGFEICSVLLLVGIVGSILIAKRRG